VGMCLLLFENYFVGGGKLRKITDSPPLWA
jgi:hypothetical protein